MDNPLVSIGIPTYNNARYIGKTLQSILNQTYQNIEIIVSDNASTDNTEEIIKSFNDDRIRYYKNSETIKCLANWNLCLKYAQGDYIAIYHSDDIYDPKIVEVELDFLLNNPKCGAVFCLDKLIDENGCFIGNGVSLPKELKGKSVFSFIEIFMAILKESGSFLIAPTFMARKEIFEEVGFFREDEKFGDSTGSAADTEMWLRINRMHLLGIISERLIYRRISTTQGSNQYESRRTTRANHFIVLDHFLKEPGIKEKIDKKTLHQHEYNKFWDDVIIAKNLVKQNKTSECRKLLLKSFSCNQLPTAFKSMKNLAKLVIFLFFLFLSLFGIAGTGMKFFRLIRGKIWLNQKI